MTIVRLHQQFVWQLRVCNDSLYHNCATTTTVCTTTVRLQRQFVQQLCDYNDSLYDNCVSTTAVCTTIVRLQRQFVRQLCVYNNSLYDNCATTTTVCTTILYDSISKTQNIIHIVLILPALVFKMIILHSRGPHSEEENKCFTPEPNPPPPPPTPPTTHQYSSLPECSASMGHPPEMWVWVPSIWPPPYPPNLHCGSRRGERGGDRRGWSTIGDERYRWWTMNRSRICQP